MQAELVGDGGRSRMPPGFQAVFDAHFGRMAGLARLLGSDDPEDTAAEAFVRLYRAWDGLRDEDPAPAYARRTVVRLSSNRRRHLAIVRAHARRERAAVEPSAESEVMRSVDEDLRNALLRLTRARRAAIALRFYADLPFAQIGQALDCSESTARAHVHRGLADLRNIWKSGSETS